MQGHSGAACAGRKRRAKTMKMSTGISCFLIASTLTIKIVAQEAAGEDKGFQALFGQPVDTLAALDALDAQAASAWPRP